MLKYLLRKNLELFLEQLELEDFEDFFLDENDPNRLTYFRKHLFNHEGLVVSLQIKRIEDD